MNLLSFLRSMNRRSFAIIFVIFDALALASCAIFAISSTIPLALFFDFAPSLKFDMALFSPFTWLYQNKVYIYHNVSGYFRFLQVMFVISFISSFICAVMAIFGYKKPQSKKFVGCFIFG
ncbi:hypothetical protein RF11_05386 [Thelohanellus kitauei]|uniref:Uncharacterized protein n=1 Tax=Thelohanellus kitauei TaxID=669202 RepID=A0A0C2N1P4_THEKT|nr:hypothetical protein RF11_05386 [Thelohanellus kitauei]